MLTDFDFMRTMLFDLAENNPQGLSPFISKAISNKSADEKFVRTGMICLIADLKASRPGLIVPELEPFEKLIWFELANTDNACKVSPRRRKVWTVWRRFRWVQFVIRGKQHGLKHGEVMRLAAKHFYCSIKAIEKAYTELNEIVARVLNSREAQ